MTDDLRTRIAQAVFDGFNTHPSEHLVLSITDSMIRELNISGLWSGSRLVGMVARWDDARPTDADLEAKEESIYGKLGEQ